MKPVAIFCFLFLVGFAKFSTATPVITLATDTEWYIPSDTEQIATITLEVSEMEPNMSALGIIFFHAGGVVENDDVEYTSGEEAFHLIYPNERVESAWVAPAIMGASTTVTYQLSIPASHTGDILLSAVMKRRVGEGGEELTFPIPVAIKEFVGNPFHDADTNTNSVIDLDELLRVIQFFNIGGYLICPNNNTEDGFCPATE